MKRIILVTLAIFPLATVFAQEVPPAASSSPAPTASNATPATAADVDALRQQVQSLTDTVKPLQQQVKDQQAALEKANITGNQLPQSEGTPSVASEPVPTHLPSAS